MPDYFDTGFTVRQPAWHGQGLVLGEHPTDWADARQKAGLTWEPMAAPSWTKVPLAEIKCQGCGALLNNAHNDLCIVNETGWVTVKDTGATGEFYIARGAPYAFMEDTEHRQIVRSDTGAVLGAGLSKNFPIIKHGEDACGDGEGSMEQIIDAFKNSDGSVKFETAGASQGGRQVWALLRLDEPYRIPGDESETIPFIALLNRHDGMGAMKVVRTQVRVVCWNTFQMASAEAERTGLQYSFRHAGDPRSRIDEAKVALSGLRDEVEEYKEMATELATLRVDDRAVDAFLLDFLPSPAEHGEVISERVQANIDKARDAFRSTYFTSVTTDGIRGTGYGLFQAATEYLDHQRAYRSKDSYLGRSILSADKAKGYALNLVREHATV